MTKLVTLVCLTLCAAGLGQAHVVEQEELFQPKLQNTNSSLSEIFSQMCENQAFLTLGTADPNAQNCSQLAKRVDLDSFFSDLADVFKWHVFNGTTGERLCYKTECISWKNPLDILNATITEKREELADRIDGVKANIHEAVSSAPEKFNELSDKISDFAGKISARINQVDLEPPKTEVEVVVVEDKPREQRYHGILNIIDGYLPIRETFSKGDPFVKVYVNGEKIGATRPILDSFYPTWDKEFELSNITTKTYIEFKAYDWDSLARNDFYCSGLIYIQEFLALSENQNGVASKRRCYNGWVNLKLTLIPDES